MSRPQRNHSEVTAGFSTFLLGRDIEVSHRFDLSTAGIDGAIQQSMEAFCRAMFGEKFPTPILAGDNPYISFELTCLIVDDSPGIISTFLSLNTGDCITEENRHDGIICICLELVSRLRPEFLALLEDLNIKLDSD